MDRASKKVVIKVGDIYEDCAYHPVKCTVSDGDDLEGVSMVDGSSPRCCSITHCGVIKLSEQEANDLVSIWKSGGEKAVMISKGWSENDAQGFIDKWR
jgi:hypothetical protein